MSARPPAERTIRFFVEWCIPTPLWGPGTGPTAPELLALSPDLCDRLRAWIDFWNEHADEEVDDFRPGVDASAWDAEGLRLPHAVAAEIGDGAWVESTDGFAHHDGRGSNERAATAFERLVAAVIAEQQKAAALRADGATFSFFAPLSGEEYRPASR